MEGDGWGPSVGMLQQWEWGFVADLKVGFSGPVGWDMG